LQKPTLIVVGADKGGVGKTTLSRTIVDYIDALQVSIRAFDTEYPQGTLKRFYPKTCTIVDMTSVSDQMKVFDSLNEKSVTLIDVRAGLLSSMLSSLRDMGFFELVKRDQAAFALVHVVGSSIASLNEIGYIAPFLTNGQYYLVKNYVNDTRFFDWDYKTYKSYFGEAPSANEIVSPKLNEMAFEQIDLASVPFTSFISNKDANGHNAEFSFVLRGYARHWLGEIWAEYDRVKLNEFVGGGRRFEPRRQQEAMESRDADKVSSLRFVAAGIDRKAESAR